MTMPQQQHYEDILPCPPLFVEAYVIRVLAHKVLVDPRLKLVKELDGSYSLNLHHSLFDPLVICYEEGSIELHLKLEKNVSVEVIELFSGSDERSSSISIELLEHARGAFYQLVDIPAEKRLRHRRSVKLYGNAYLSNHYINLSAGNFKHNFTIELLEARATADFYLLDQLYASAQSTTNLTIFHAAPQTESTQLVRAIYTDNANGSFLGKVIVEHGSAKSSAKQHYKTVLLSERAKASVMPQLEINNFDISASHGATVGELDKNVLFYLESRGLSTDEAKILLVSALNKEITNRIPRDEVREFIEEKVSIALSNALGVANV